MIANTEPRAVHLGRNIKRIREVLQIKQQTLANHLGDDWSQKKISQLEDKEMIDDALLAEVAKALNVSVEAIKKYDEESHITNIQNNYEGSNANATNVGPAGYMNYQCSFNPIDKLMEAIDRNENLYERLLQSEKEKVDLLKQVLEKLQ